MYVILILVALYIAALAGIPFLDGIITKFPDTNKFKRWWRNHMVGEEK